MTVTAAEVPAATQAEQDAAARREAQIRALEAAAVAAVTAALAARLAVIVGDLRDAFTAWAGTNPARWRIARQDAARELRGIQVNLAPAITRVLTQAARLGAAQAAATAGLPAPGRTAPPSAPAPPTLPTMPIPRRQPATTHLPPGHDPTADPLIADAIDKVDAAVTAKLEVAAARLEERVDTPAQLEDAIGRVDAATGEAKATTGDAVARSVQGGIKAVADAQGMGRVWVLGSRDACLHCQGMAGSVAAPDGLFREVRQFAAKSLPWVADGVDKPPLHRSCRCTTMPDTAGLADSLRREAERDVARGWSAYDSLPARLKALDAILRRSRLPKSVVERAATDRRRGAFSSRHKPRLPYRSGRS